MEKEMLEKSLCYFDSETGEYVKLTGKIKSEKEFNDFTNIVYGTVGKLDTAAASTKIYKKKNTTADFMNICRKIKNSPVIVLDDFFGIYKSENEIIKKSASKPIKKLLSLFEFTSEERSSIEEYNVMLRATAMPTQFFRLNGNTRIKEEFNSALSNTRIMKMINFIPNVVKKEECEHAKVFIK